MSQFTFLCAFFVVAAFAVTSAYGFKCFHCGLNIEMANDNNSEIGIGDSLKASIEDCAAFDKLSEKERKESYSIKKIGASNCAVCAKYYDTKGDAKVTTLRRCMDTKFQANCQPVDNPLGGICYCDKEYCNGSGVNRLSTFLAFGVVCRQFLSKIN